MWHKWFWLWQVEITNEALSQATYNIHFTLLNAFARSTHRVPYYNDCFCNNIILRCCRLATLQRLTRLCGNIQRIARRLSILQLLLRAIIFSVILVACEFLYSQIHATRCTQCGSCHFYGVFATNLNEANHESCVWYVLLSMRIELDDFLLLPHFVASFL